MKYFEHIGQGYYMAYKAPDKPLRDFTPEEREELIAELKASTTPEAWESLSFISGLLRDVSGWMQSDEAKETGAAIKHAAISFREALPLLEEEIERDPETKGMTLDEALDSGKLDDLLDRVANRMEKRAITAITTRGITSLDFPLDKVNSKIWQLFEEARDVDGQMRLAIGVESEADKRKGKQIDIAYSIDFAELEKLENVSITRKLEPFDKRTYIAIGAIFDTGQESMSYQQIYSAMGYSGRAGARDLKKIDESVTKMSGARIYIDNLQESREYKSKSYFKYDGALLPMERITGVVNGQLAESVIHVFRSLPMLDFARERRQFTTIERRLLDSPISKTNANIQLEDYLIDRISRMKSGKAKARMLFTTIYENAGMTQKKQKQRAWAKIEKLLEHYKACGFIKDYAKDEKGVTIEL